MEKIDKSDLRQLLWGERWSNVACCGYLILACEKEGLGKEQILQLLAGMEQAFGSVSVERAANVYTQY